MQKIIRVGIYGSSLFLSAVAASLNDHKKISILDFPAATPVRSVLLQDPAILLWGSHCPPPGLSILRSDGMLLVEIDERSSKVSIQHPGQSGTLIIDVKDSTELIAWIYREVEMMKCSDITP